MLNLDVATVIFQIINFLFFFGLLYWLLFKPVTATIKQRRQQRERMLREVERERQAVSVQRAELDERLSRLDEESVTVIALARERAEEERRALLQEAREEQRNTSSGFVTWIPNQKISEMGRRSWWRPSMT